MVYTFISEAQTQKDQIHVQIRLQNLHTNYCTRHSPSFEDTGATIAL